MDKSNLTKYTIIALTILGILYLGYLNRKISGLEKAISNSRVTGITETEKPKPKASLAELLAPAVDKTKMQACLDSGKYDSQLDADQALATDLGVRGTPGFFINATGFEGAYSFTMMEATVSSALQGITVQPKSQPAVTLSQVKEVFNKALIKFGDTNNKVIALEISDPSCPYCQIAGGKNSVLNNQTPQFKLVADGGTYVSPVMEIKKLVDTGQASFALIYFPGHGNGVQTMKALYCAFEMGKFWEVNDIVMSAIGYDWMNN